MIRLIIFDHDGVIVDARKSVYEVYKKICSAFNLACPEGFEEFKKTPARGYKKHFLSLGIQEEDHHKAEEIFAREIMKYEHKVFEEIERVIKTLASKYILLVISGNFKEEVIKNLKKIGCLKYFKKIIAKETSTEPPLDKSRHITQLLKELNLRKEEAVLIGDMDGDYLAARDAGLKHVIMVEYGYGYKRENKQFYHKTIVEKPIDILKAMEEIEESEKP